MKERKGDRVSKPVYFPPMYMEKGYTFYPVHEIVVRDRMLNTVIKLNMKVMEVHVLISSIFLNAGKLQRLSSLESPTKLITTA